MVNRIFFTFNQCFGSGSYHLAGSGSTSGNEDPDPGSKKNLVGDNVAYSLTEKKVHIILVQG